MARNASNLAAGALLVLAGCAPRPTMCVAPNECGAQSTCVAGRCQRRDGTPAIQTTRRLVLEPVAMAYLRRGDGPRGGALPPAFILGREKDGEARLFLRFTAPMPRETTVVEAYLLLERALDLDADPAPIRLHAARVIDPWDPRSLSWALQPRIEETRSPSTTVTTSGRTRIRIDVKNLVARWGYHDPMDHGIVILADTLTPTGMAFAFAPMGMERPGGGLLAESKLDVSPTSPLGLPPQLEIYVK